MTTLAYQIVAAAMHDRQCWDALAASGELDAMPEVLKLITGAMAGYYSRDPDANHADPAVIAELAGAGMTNPKHRETLKDMVDAVTNAAPSSPNIAALLKASAKDRIGHELSVALVSGREPDEIQALMAQYGDLSVEDGPESELDWAEVVRRRSTGQDRIKIPIASLNTWLGGGLLPGHNVTIFARPETGKTALSITLAVGFARNGTKVLYCGNEDPARDLMVRAIQCATKASAEQIKHDPEGVVNAALGKGIARLKFRELSPGSLAELEKLVRIERPGVLIVDQLRNVKAKSENMTQRLDAVAQGVRALGKRYKIATISITQAGDSARNKAVLDDGDIDSSNTGIPGAADVLIGMGVTEELDRAGLRMLSVCKNKITGQRGHFQVRIDPAISRISSHD